MTHFRIPLRRGGADMSDVIRESGTLPSAMNPNKKMAEMIDLIDLNGGQAAERLCDRIAIAGGEMDAWALRSHPRAVPAQRGGRLRAEIVPVDGRSAEGQPVHVEHDQGPGNQNRGACPLGPPVGASGARLAGTAALQMGRRVGRFGLAAICDGMGQGATTILALEE